MPLLLAEGDREIYKREEAAKVRERELMKDVKGWVRYHIMVRTILMIIEKDTEKKVYNNGKYRGVESISVL